MFATADNLDKRLPRICKAVVNRKDLAKIGFLGRTTEVFNQKFLVLTDETQSIFRQMLFSL